MKRMLLAAAAAFALAACGQPAQQQAETPPAPAEVAADAPHILAALADSRRPAEDVARDAGRPARVHLKIDSGLHRNGVRPEDWPAFTARAAQLVADAAIDVVGVWSHIAEASDDEDDLARAAYDLAV